METGNEGKRTVGSMARRWGMFIALAAGVALTVVGVLKWRDLCFLLAGAGGVGMTFLALIWGGLFLDGQPSSVRVTLLAFAGLILLIFLIGCLTLLLPSMMYPY
jgi:hypothetical protein